MSNHCCGQQTVKQKNKGSIDPFVIGIVVTTLVILAGVIYFATLTSKPVEVTADIQAELKVDSEKYDWGTIDINGGIVSKSFTIENTGNTPLKLYEVVTSCMCTTAQLKTDTQTSKKFGMHDQSNSVFEVAAGEIAELIVEFDPAFHGPSGVGAISRTVTVKTNAEKTPELSFNLTAQVVKN